MRGRWGKGLSQILPDCKAQRQLRWRAWQIPGEQGARADITSDSKWSPLPRLDHQEHSPSTLLLLLLSHVSRVRLCDPTDGSPPGSPVPGILQARTLEWVAMSFSNA